LFDCKLTGSVSPDHPRDVVYIRWKAIRPVSASICFGGAGFSGADSVFCPEGDEEHATIAIAAQSVRSDFQIVVIGANNNVNFSSQTQMRCLGIKLTTCEQSGVFLRRFTRKESSTLSPAAASIEKDSRN